MWVAYHFFRIIAAQLNQRADFPERADAALVLVKKVIGYPHATQID